MTKRHLEKLFQTFGLVTLAIALNVLIVGQGGKALLDTPLLGDGHASQAFFGIVLVSSLLVLMSLVGALHAVRHGTAWHDRLPVVWLEDLDTRRWDGKLFQLVMIALLVVGPAVALFKFQDTVETGHLCVLGSTVDFSVIDKWREGFPGEREQVRLVDELVGHGSDPATCGRGIQVFPPGEFTGLFLLPKVALAACAMLLAVVFRGRFEPRRISRSNDVGEETG